jgi:hypothetical protein
MNLGIMGLGANVWGEGTLKTGLFFSLLIAPLFIYRHYCEDKGLFPKQLLADVQISSEAEMRSKVWFYIPYITLAIAIVVVCVSSNL